MKFRELIKLIWRYLKPYKKMVYFCILLATISSGISAVIPLVYGRLVDEAIEPQVNLELIGIILLLWLIFVLIANWMTRFINFQGSKLGNKVFKSFIVDIYFHYLQLPLDFHKNKRVGEQFDRISRAGSRLWALVESVIFYILPSFLTAVIAVILMFTKEWRMTFVLVVILTFYTIATIIKTKPIIKAEKLSNRFWEKVWGGIFDSIRNVQIVKSHIKEDDEKKDREKSFERVINKMTDFFRGWRNLSAWQNNIQGLGFVVIFGIALYLLTQKQITAGILVSFVGYVNLVFRPFNQLADNYRLVQRGLVTIGRAVKLYDIDKELYDHGQELEQIKGKIEFKNVSFSYGEKYKRVLRNIDFIAKPGEVVALVGESGAGKTTLLSLISRYYNLDNGRILLDNNNINDINLVFLRQQIAIVPQEVSLFNDTIRKNLAYAKKGADDREIINALKAANAWEFVNSFPKKLSQKVGERGIKLSTGQKQRVAIARAILRDPKILILDEATSSLDSVSERLVQDALKHLIAGRTTFIIAHRLSTITHADKILVFDKGKLVEQGSHQRLIKHKGVYYNLYQEQKF